jgi:hypothetical protein
MSSNGYSQPSYEEGFEKDQSDVPNSSSDMRDHSGVGSSKANIDDDQVMMDNADDRKARAEAEEKEELEKQQKEKELAKQKAAEEQAARDE